MAKPFARKFYNSSAWIKTSKAYKNSKFGICEKCGAIGEEVHHIIPIQTVEGWNNRLDYNNTMSVCLECHNYYHKRFQRRKTNEATTNSNR